MAQLQGIVSKKGIDKYNKHFIRIQGDPGWFSSQYEIKCNEGDEVTFDSGPNGKWCSKLQVLGAGVGAPPAAGGGGAPTQRTGGGYAGGGGDARQDSIERQNALTNTVQTINDMEPKVKKAWYDFFKIEKSDQNEGILTIYVHSFYGKLIKGDVTVAKLEAARAAAVEPEPAPVAESVVETEPAPNNDVPF